MQPVTKCLKSSENIYNSSTGLILSLWVPQNVREIVKNSSQLVFRVGSLLSPSPGRAPTWPGFLGVQESTQQVWVGSSPLGGRGGPGGGGAVGRDSHPEQQHCLHAGGAGAHCDLLECLSSTDKTDKYPHRGPVLLGWPESWESEHFWQHLKNLGNVAAGVGGHACC